MARGTFANIRLLNKFIGKAGPKTIHIPSNEQVNIGTCTVMLALKSTEKQTLSFQETT